MPEGCIFGLVVAEEKSFESVDGRTTEEERHSQKLINVQEKHAQNNELTALFQTGGHSASPTKTTTTTSILTYFLF